jgi:hypothetical protein
MTIFLIGVLAVAADARAQAMPGSHWCAASRQISREACAQLAVEAMGVKEKFAFAEVTPDGNARGWNGQSSVAVLSFPRPSGDTIQFLVIAASKDTAEAERLRNVVRDHVLSAEANADSPKRVGTGKEPHDFSIDWRAETRNAIGLVRFFDAAACIVLEKQGFKIQNPAPTMVAGTREDHLATAFYAPTSSGISFQFNVLTISTSHARGEGLAADLLSRILKIIYD